MVLKEYKIDNYITLKLEDGVTNIYIKDDLFKQCTSLLLKKIHLNNMEEYISKFKSIDEETNSLERINFNEITPEVEFWGHCSNLQVWVECNYDTTLLHRNLAFPLLKKLSDKGSKLATIKFKEEIIRRLQSGESTVINYLLEEDYIQYLSKEELYFSILEFKEADALIRLEQSAHRDYGLVESFLNLQSIDSAYDELFVVRNGSIEALQVYLENPNIHFFQEIFSEFMNLEILYIYINQFLDYLPEPRDRIESLKELRIIAYGETTLPNFFNKFPHLERLYIHGGYFKSPPETLSSLKGLKLLHIDKTSIKYLPESISNLSSLENLKLNCSLWDFPVAITRLKKIKNLELNSSLLNGRIEKWIKTLKLYNLVIH